MESRAIVLLLLGAAGVGKSSFKRLILRWSPPVVHESTPLAEAAIRTISICRATIGGRDMEWQYVSSEELLRTVADAIKAGVPVRLLPLTRFLLHVLPPDANYSKVGTGFASQPSSSTPHSLPPFSFAA